MSVQVKKFRAALKYGGIFSDCHPTRRGSDCIQGIAPEKAHALALWNDRLLGIVRGKTAAKVLPLKRTKRGRG
jgi:hypothetical protein